MFTNGECLRIGQGEPLSDRLPSALSMIRKGIPHLLDQCTHNFLSQIRRACRFIRSVQLWEECLRDIRKDSASFTKKTERHVNLFFFPLSLLFLDCTITLIGANRLHYSVTEIWERECIRQKSEDQICLESRDRESGWAVKDSIGKRNPPAECCRCCSDTRTGCCVVILSHKVPIWARYHHAQHSSLVHIWLVCNLLRAARKNGW